jgi:hypothetical protein
MNLIKQDSIPLWTRNGECEIHLLYGDITQLAMDDKVDLIMVSAFPGLSFDLRDHKAPGVFSVSNLP